MTDELRRLTELIKLQPGATSLQLRDALRDDGRSSMTVADVERTLHRAPGEFTSSADAPRRWWRAEVGPPTTQLDLTLRIAPGTESGSEPRPGPALYRWQVAALGAWRTAGHRGVIEAVTGAGKTMIGLVAAREEVERRGQVAIIVPTRELLAQWASLLGSALPDGTSVGLLGDGSRQGLDRHDVVVAVVNSARVGELHPRRPGGLLVADECHRYGSAQNSLVLSDRFQRRLGLSATFARSDDAHRSLLEPYLGGICYRVGYAEATRDGVIAEFDVVLVTVGFSPAERAGYEALTQQMATAIGGLISGGHMRVEVSGAFFAQISTLARGDGDATELARSYLRSMQERRRLMDEASAKQEVLAALASNISAANRSIVFTQTVEAAESAAATLRTCGVRASVLHSQLRPHERTTTMRAFRDGTVIALAAPQVLDEGVDVPEADLAVVLGASRSRRQMVQRMGRVLRRKADGRRARFVVVTVRDTVEDPERGAHEMFLDEVTSVARRVDIISFGEHHDRRSGMLLA